MRRRSPALAPNRSTWILLTALGWATACSAGESREHVASLSAAQFSERLGASAAATLLDVRTPGEFRKGHLARAVNVDWYGDDFDRRVAGLDRAKPVFVYCLSGARSAEAARRLAGSGFREIYDLAGGIVAWRAAGLPQADESAAQRGMSRAQFDELVAGDRPVLVDFYAEWCIPCREMKPWLEQLARDRASDLRVERIDADDNQELLRELGVDVLPTVELYREGRRSWKKTGLTTLDEALSAIDAKR